MRGRKQWWLEVPDCLGPQEHMLQELCFTRPSLLGHVRKPFIRVATQEHDPLLELTRAKLGAGRQLRKPFICLVVLADQLLEEPAQTDVGILRQADRQKWFCPINKPSLAAARPVDPSLNGLRRRRANPVLAGAAHRAHGLGGRAAVLHRDRFHVG